MPKILILILLFFCATTSQARVQGGVYEAAFFASCFSKEAYGETSDICDAYKNPVDGYIKASSLSLIHILSLVHMHMKKQQENHEEVEYVVLSMDIDDSDTPVKIGNVFINKTSKSYKFVQSSELTGIKLIPPELFLLEKSEFDREVSKSYIDCGYAAWSSRVNEWTMILILANRYPKSAPM